MVLICTYDERQAKELGRAVRGKCVSATSADKPLADGTTASEHLLSLVRSLRPSAILLDVRYGGTGGVRYGGTALRAVELVPLLLRESPLSAVIVVTYAPSDEEIDEIRRLGAYTFVDLKRTDGSNQVRDAVSNAQADAAERAEAGLSSGAGSVH